MLKEVIRACGGKKPVFLWPPGGVVEENNSWQKAEDVLKSQTTLVKAILEEALKDLEIENMLDVS